MSSYATTFLEATKTPSSFDRTRKMFLVGCITVDLTYPVDGVALACTLAECRSSDGLCKVAIRVDKWGMYARDLRIDNRENEHS